MILEWLLVLVNFKLHDREVDDLAETGHVIDRAELISEGENNLDDLILLIDKVEVGVRSVVEKERQLDRLPFFNIRIEC